MKYEESIKKEIIMACCFSLIITGAIISMCVNTIRHQDRIVEGTKVIIDGDTLKVTHYFAFLDRYTLSDESKISGELLRTFK